MGKLEAICAGLIFIIGFFARNLFSNNSKAVVSEEKVKDVQIDTEVHALSDDELDALLENKLRAEQKAKSGS